MSIAAADLAVRPRWSADRDDGAVDGRVDVGARRGADVEHVRAGGPPSSWYQRGASLARARDPVPEPREEALVRLAADRLERRAAVVRAVEPDRGHDGGRDGQLDLEVPDRREHCGSRWRTAVAAAERRRSSIGDRRSADPPEPNAVRSSVTTPSTPSTDERARAARARRWARRLRSRRRAACRERGEAIGGTVAHVERRLHPAPEPRDGQGYDRARERVPQAPTIRIPRWIQLVGPAGRCCCSRSCWRGRSATSSSSSSPPR